MSRRERHERVWRRQHGISETRLQRALVRYFTNQGNRLADAIQAAGEVPPIGQLFDAAEEREQMRVVMHADLLRLMGLGANQELQAAPRKSFDLPDAFADPFHLPDAIWHSLCQALASLEKQPYWARIQATTRTRLAGCIRDGIEDGLGLRDVVRKVRAGLGGGTAEARARKIARTETTGTLNAGHYEARLELIREGLVRGSEWLGLRDARQRPDHAELDGKIVSAGELFNVGGHLAPYPGHCSLPPAERINCRCTTVAAGTFADD